MSGDLIFVLAIVVIIFLIAWGIFGRTASGISTRPWSRRGGPAEAQAGAETPAGGPVGAADEGRPPMTHGTR